MTFPKLASADFQDGYLPAMELVHDYETSQHGKPQVDKIIFTSDYGQPYIYALFVRRTNPIWYQGGSLIKYEFKPVTVGDLLRTNTLIVGSNQNDLPFWEADHLIYGQDGAIRFQLYYKK